MTDDIVRRLRWFANGEAKSGIGKTRGALLHEAANEIEQLRAAMRIEVGEITDADRQWAMDELAREDAKVRNAALDEVAQAVESAIAAALRALKGKQV